MQAVETKLLQHLYHTYVSHIFVTQQEEAILQECRVSSNVLCNSGWQLWSGVWLVAGPGQPGIITWFLIKLMPKDVIFSFCFIAGDGTIQINQSLAHQSRPASTLVQQSFASAFKRDRSVGPKRTGKPMSLTL